MELNFVEKKVVKAVVEDLPTYSMSYQELIDGFDRGPSRSDKF